MNWRGETPVNGWRWRRRSAMTLFAALIISLPFVWLPVAVGLFGAMVWAALFLPALLGIVLFQLPIKTILVAHRWSREHVARALMLANCILTVGIALALGFTIDAWGAVALVATAVLASTVWNELDNRALFGGDQGDYLA